MQLENLRPSVLLACDSHIHVYGPKNLYPVIDEARYNWYESPLEAHAPFARANGIDRVVIVQPSIYGTDNRCTLDAAHQLGTNGRAVVDINPYHTTLAQLKAMHTMGARGARLTVTLSQRPDADLAARTKARIQALVSVIKPMEWHLELMTPGWLTTLLLPVLRVTEIDYCFAHMAGLKPSESSTPADFEAFLNVISDPDQRCHLKLSAFYRVSNAPMYSDLESMIRKFVAEAPKRLFWGTDFPHPSFSDREVPQSQLDMLYRCVKDSATLEQILVHNPARFYRFDRQND